MSMFTTSATITRNQHVTDGVGGWTESAVVIETTDARVRSLSWSERKDADQFNATISHRIYLPADSAVDRSDIATIDSREYRIQAIKRLSVAHHIECDAEEIQRATT